MKYVKGAIWTVLILLCGIAWHEIETSGIINDWFWEGTLQFVVVSIFMAVARSLVLAVDRWKINRDYRKNNVLHEEKHPAIEAPEGVRNVELSTSKKSCQSQHLAQKVNQPIRRKRERIKSSSVAVVVRILTAIVIVALTIVLWFVSRKLDSASAELLEVKSSIDNISSENLELQTENKKLSEDNSSLRKTLSTLNSIKDRYVPKLKFYESNAVVVMRDETNLYHQYGGHVGENGKPFWIYDVASAKLKGYRPCPHCFTADYYVVSWTNRFHLPTCPDTATMPYRIYYDTKQEAITEGYKPCEKCNP